MYGLMQCETMRNGSLCGRAIVGQAHSSNVASVVAKWQVRGEEISRDGRETDAANAP